MIFVCEIYIVFSLSMDIIPLEIPKYFFLNLNYNRIWIIGRNFTLTHNNVGWGWCYKTYATPVIQLSMNKEHNLYHFVLALKFLYIYINIRFFLIYFEYHNLNALLIYFYYFVSISACSDNIIQKAEISHLRRFNGQQINHQTFPKIWDLFKFFSYKLLFSSRKYPYISPFEFGCFPIFLLI